MKRAHILSFAALLCGFALGGVSAQAESSAGPAPSAGPASPTLNYFRAFLGGESFRVLQVNGSATQSFGSDGHYLMVGGEYERPIPRLHLLVGGSLALTHIEGTSASLQILPRLYAHYLPFSFSRKVAIFLNLELGRELAFLYETPAGSSAGSYVPNGYWPVSIGPEASVALGTTRLGIGASYVMSLSGGAAGLSSFNGVDAFARFVVPVNNTDTIGLRLDLEKVHGDFAFAGDAGAAAATGTLHQNAFRAAVFAGRRF